MRVQDQMTAEEHCAHGIPVNSPSACPSCHSRTSKTVVSTHHLECTCDRCLLVETWARVSGIERHLVEQIDRLAAKTSASQWETDITAILDNLGSHMDTRIKHTGGNAPDPDRATFIQETDDYRRGFVAGQTLGQHEAKLEFHTALRETFRARQALDDATRLTHTSKYFYLAAGLIGGMVLATIAWGLYVGH